jgi:hypothetical protein
LAGPVLGLFSSAITPDQCPAWMHTPFDVSAKVPLEGDGGPWRPENGKGIGHDLREQGVMGTGGVGSLGWRAGQGRGGGRGYEQLGAPSLHAARDNRRSTCPNTVSSTDSFTKVWPRRALTGATADTTPPAWLAGVVPGKHTQAHKQRARDGKGIPGHGTTARRWGSNDGGGGGGGGVCGGGGERYTPGTHTRSRRARKEHARCARTAGCRGGPGRCQGRGAGGQPGGSVQHSTGLGGRTRCSATQHTRQLVLRGAGQPRGNTASATRRTLPHTHAGNPARTRSACWRARRHISTRMNL